MKNYIESILKGILIGSLAVFVASTANAKGIFTAEQDQEAWCMAQNVYYEARGSNLADMYAVADVVLNRAKDTRYPNTVCDVVRQGEKHASGKMKRNRCQFSWYCDGKSDWPTNNDAWVKAQNVAYLIMYTSQHRGITEGATHYHADYVKPRWASSLQLVGRIGDHIYYRWSK